MERQAQHFRATLGEELSLLRSLIELTEETTRALVRRDTRALLGIGSRQQTQLMRLQIVRETIVRLGAAYLESCPPDESFQGTGLRALLRRAGDEESLALTGEIEKAAAHLAARNSVNSRLLEKQYASLTAFRQLLDLVTGVEQVYDRQGGMQQVGSAGRLEQQV